MKTDVIRKRSRKKNAEEPQDKDTSSSKKKKKLIHTPSSVPPPPPLPFMYIPQQPTYNDFYNHSITPPSNILSMSNPTHGAPVSNSSDQTSSSLQQSTLVQSISLPQSSYSQLGHQLSLQANQQPVYTRPPPGQSLHQYPQAGQNHTSQLSHKYSQKSQQFSQNNHDQQSRQFSHFSQNNQGLHSPPSQQDYTYTKDEKYDTRFKSNNTHVGDIMFMSQMMANEDPLGRVSESLVDDLYGFNDDPYWNLLE